MPNPKMKSVKIGDKGRLLIPGPALSQLNLTKGSTLKVDISNGTITLTPVDSEELPEALERTFAERQQLPSKGELSLDEFSTWALENGRQVDEKARNLRVELQENAEFEREERAGYLVG